MRYPIVTILGAALIALVAVSPAFGADTIIQPLSGGTRTASVADLTMDALSYAHTNQLSSGTLELTVDDSSGSDLGWNVTVQSSALAYSGSYTGSSIPATNLALGTPDAPAPIIGQAIDATDGPLAGSGGTLDVARKVLYANAGYGKGTYTQSLPVTLTVPGMSLAGSYAATFTVTVSAGP